MSFFYSFMYARSPFWAMSSPTSSSFGVTRIPPGQIASIIFSIAIVTPNAYATERHAPAMLIACCSYPSGVPVHAPIPSPVSHTCGLANVPVKTAPVKPPIPCTPHTSRASSHLREFLNATAP